MALTKIDDRGLKTPIDLLDNEKIRLGTGNDLEVYHDGTQSQITESGTGLLYINSNVTLIRNSAGNENQITAEANGSVGLYYDNSKKLETTSGGVDIPGVLTVDQVWLNDAQELRLGTDIDLKLVFDGSNSYILNSTSGLFLRSDGIYLKNAPGTENFIDCSPNAEVSLFYDGSKKLETRSNGISIHGNQIDLKRSSTTDQESIFYYGSSYLDIETREATGIRLKTNKQDRLIIDSNGVLWNGVTPFANHFTNRSAYFHKSGSSDWNYISITGGTSGGSGIVFGDSVENNTGNYESLIAHDNTNNSLYLKTKQSEKGLELKVGGDVSILDGNLVVASGHGIDFSATGTPLSGSSSNSELFQDYERGSWTMGFQYYNTTTNAWTTVPFDNSPDYDSFDYVKCGHLVHVWGYTGGFDVGSDAVNKSARFTGLPYAAVWAAPYYGASCIFTHTSAFGDTSGNVEYVATGYTPYNEPVLYPMRPKTDSIAAWMNGSKTFMFSATYETAS